MMQKKNRTKYVILGILSSKSASGYSIKKFIEESISHFWKESYGQIYPTLKKLEADGYVDGELSVYESGRSKKVYKITRAGHDEMMNWLKSNFHESTVREEMLLKLFFGKELGKEGTEKLLLEHREKILEAKATLEIVEEHLAHVEDEEKPWWMMTLKFGISNCKHRIQWVNESLEYLDAELGGS